MAGAIGLYYVMDRNSIAALLLAALLLTVGITDNSRLLNNRVVTFGNLYLSYGSFSSNGKTAFDTVAWRWLGIICNHSYFGFDRGVDFCTGSAKWI